MLRTEGGKAGGLYPHATGHEDRCTSEQTSSELVVEILLKPKMNTSHFAGKIRKAGTEATQKLLIIRVFETIRLSLLRPGRGANSKYQSSEIKAIDGLLFSAPGRYNFYRN